jgi:phosphoribosylaminoimidazolecarboxamide formyltransferase/IMP cyclohydrolase
MVTNYDLDLLRDFGSTLRYGENPHQNGVVIGDSGVAGAQLISGKQMSYNNYLDADAAFSALLAHSMPTVVFVKHSNPCGLASASELSSAFTAALNCDPISAYGGVIAVNKSLDIKTAKLVVENFYEVIIAPEFQEDALKVLETKKNLRVVKISKPTVHNSEDDFASWRLVSGKPADDLQILDLNFAWRVVKSVKSNAIVLVKNLATVGIGMGQVNRVDAAKHAVERASLNAKGCIAASDGFFPFVDGIEELANAGVTTLVQPGGSIRDEELIKFCNKNNLTMYFTGIRHFLH